MRILVLSNLYPPYALGGYEILCEQVVERLRRRGHTIEVLTSSHGATEGENLGDTCTVHRRLRLESPFDQPADTRRRHRLTVGRCNAAIVREHIRSFRPDVIFIWSLLRLGVAPARTAEQSGVPVAYTINDINLAGYAPRRPGLPLRRLGRALLDRTLHRHATLACLELKHVTCISLAVRDASVSRGAPVSDARVFHQGIPLEHFPFAHPRLGSGALRVLYVGQLHEYKGVHVLLDAARRCRTRITVTVAGRGDEAYEARLREIAPRNVEFLGHVPHAELPAVYRNHDALVFPSLRDEAFGLTWIEAMASGTPVVATPAGGQAEVLQDQVNALVVPPGDAPALASALDRLASETELRRRLAREGRATVERRLSLDRYVDDMERFLRDARTDRKPCSVVMLPRRFTRESWGGTETVVLETSRRLADRGHAVEIYTTKALSRSGRSGTVDGLPVRRFSYFYPFCGLTEADVERMDGKGGNLFSFSLLRALLRRQPALIHLHTLKRLGGIGRWVARRLRIPYVVSLHGNVLDVPADEREDLLAPIRRSFEWGRALGLAVGSRRVLDDAAAILCVSRSEAERVRRRYPDRRVVHLPHGVDSLRFRSGDGTGFRLEHGIPTSRRVVLTMGRIDPQKNQVRLVRALARRDDLHILLIGHVTHPEYAASLRHEIRRHGMESRVTVLEGLPYGDRSLVDAYHAADVFCLPSIHEPFGIVLLEAWSAGLPVAAARVSGPLDLVEEGRDGALFDPESVDEIAHAVDRALGSAAAFASAGRSKVERDYDWQAITTRLTDCYDQVLRGGEQAA